MSRAQIRILVGGVSFLGAALLAMGSAWLLRTLNIALNGPTLLVFTGTVVVASLGMVALSALWMRVIDEAAQEAHKWAWYWGGSTGMGVGLVGFVFAAFPSSAIVTFPTFSGRTDPAAYAATGAMGIVLLMMLGYAIAWVWWWLSKR